MRKIPIFIYFIFLILSLSVSVKAQYNQPLKDYVIEAWSAQEGLPSNNLRSIAKDKNGFLWITTFNGLVRFDGVQFKIFDSKNIEGLLSSSFYSVLPLSNGDLIINSQSSGIFKHSHGEFSKLPNTENLPPSVHTTFLDNNKRLWIGTRNNGIFYLENNILSKFSISEFNTRSITCFTEDSLNNIWVGSEGAGIAKISPDANYEIYSTANGLVSNQVNSVIYHDQIVYVGTEKGLSTYSNSAWEVDERCAKLSINFITTDASSNLWIAADNGLARIIHDGKYEFISEKNGLLGRQVSAIAFDDESNIWITTKRGGLVQLKLSNFKNIAKKDGLSYQGVNVIEEGPDSTYYIGTDNGDIDIIQNGKISKLIVNKDLSDVSVKDIYAEEDGTLWIATYDGVIKKNGNKEVYYGVEQGLLSNKTRRILKDSKGIIWVGSRNGGLNKILPNGDIESISVKEGLGSDFVFSVDEAPDGRIVVGTANGGLDIIHLDGSIEILTPDSLIVGLSIFNVYIESNDRFWLATNVGIFCYQKNGFALINVKNGMPVETLFDIKEDEIGDLWATSILGIVKISKKEAIAVTNKKQSFLTASLLNDSDGMISRECTGTSTSLLASNGKIWIPTIGGVAIFDPQKLILNFKEPAVFIEEILVDDDKLSWNIEELGERSVIIPAGHRNYSINFTSLSMYSPDKVKFTYKLEGFDEDWVENGASRTAKYTNIPYGTYTFKVMAANNNGVWSADFAKVIITIEPFFYETTFFVVALILGFVLATILIYNYQTKEVNRRNRELLKLNGELDSFAYSVSHDLKAPLSSIQGLLNVARLEKGENAMEYYSRIDTSVDKLDNFIKDIIDYSKNSRLEVKKEYVNVKSLINGMCESLAYLNKEKEIAVEIGVDESLEILTDKTRFTFISNNLLTNAFRYADFTKPTPFISVSAKVTNNVFYLVVDDNGQGIKKELQARIYDMFFRANEKSEGSGLGLYIVKESLTKLKGKITIDSDLDIGTTVRIEFPV